MGKRANQYKDADRQILPDSRDAAGGARDGIFGWRERVGAQDPRYMSDKQDQVLSGIAAATRARRERTA